MNRRFFLRSLFGASLALSSGGLWLPSPKPEWTLIPNVFETRCVRRTFSQEYLQALHNDGKPLNLDEIFKLFYELKRARDEMGLTGDIHFVGLKFPTCASIHDIEIS